MVMPEIKDVSAPIRHLILFDHAATAKHFGAILVFDAEGRLTIDASTDTDPRPKIAATRNTSGFNQNHQRPRYRRANVQPRYASSAPDPEKHPLGSDRTRITRANGRYWCRSRRDRTGVRMITVPSRRKTDDESSGPQAQPAQQVMKIAERRSNPTTPEASVAPVMPG